MGNYLYCCSCIRNIETEDRKQKREQSQLPITELEKSEVEEERLGDYVIMPNELSVWGGGPYLRRQWFERHGKSSHSAKVSVKDDFLQFVDDNTQPNGRSADTSGPTHYFLPKFSTIQCPKLSRACCTIRCQRIQQSTIRGRWRCHLKWSQVAEGPQA